MRWMNRQIYIPITTFVTRKGESLARGKVGFMHVRMKRHEARHQEAVDEIKAHPQREHGVKDFDVFSRVANLRRNEQNNKMYDMTFMICGIISLLVGGIVVMNIQLASFNERVREVGTRKAVGASPAQIFFQFLCRVRPRLGPRRLPRPLRRKALHRRHRRADARPDGHHASARSSRRSSSPPERDWSSACTPRSARRV